MGIESFYLNAKHIPAEQCEKITQYRAFFHVSVDAGRGGICMQGALVSFLPVCCMMFRAYCALRGTAPDPVFESRGVILPADLADETAFLACMHRIWAEKLAYLSGEFGAFVLLPEEWYSTRRRLAKYYKKLPEKGDLHADD